MKAHVLILNYNGAALLRRFLPSFVRALERAKTPCRVSVVDNASVDESRLVVESFGGKIGWIPMSENRVLCSYNDAARELDDDLLIFMNRDIEVEAYFIDPLCRPFASDKDVFFTTMRVMSMSQKVYEGNRTRARLHYGVFWSSAIFPEYEKSIDRLGETFQGGFGAFDRKKFLELGGYDDIYLPGRLEDSDICFRAQKNGWKCLYVPDSIVHHQGGTSFHKAFGVKKTLVINWRNTFLFMVKNLELFSLLQMVLWLPVRLAYSVIAMKPELAIGFFQAVPRFGEALRRRKAAAVPSTIRDKAIFERV